MILLQNQKKKDISFGAFNNFVTETNNIACGLAFSLPLNNLGRLRA